jgi:predicted Na+-dependent transporter
MLRHVGLTIGKYRELALVAVAAAVGLTVQSPLEWLVRHQGIDVLLVILVFSTALNIEPRELRNLPAAWRPLSVALVVGISVLPALSWLVAHLVSPGPLRQGITTIGLAPCEIASIATTAMARGDVALAGGVLIGSTILTVVLAGPVLAFEVSGASLDPWHILVNLLCIVAVPLAAGVTLQYVVRLPRHTRDAAAATSTVSVAVLVSLVAAEVHFTSEYAPALGAILLFLATCAAAGAIVGRRRGAPARKALLLAISMRDFAIAAGLATTAFGARAAAPLGLYGIAVLAWGTGSAGFMRARSPGEQRSPALKSPSGARTSRWPSRRHRRSARPGSPSTNPGHGPVPP